MLNQGMREGFVQVSADPGGLVLLFQCCVVQTCLAPSPACGATAVLACAGELSIPRAGTSAANTRRSAAVQDTVLTCPM